MNELIIMGIILTAFSLGRWSAQRRTEKVNDVMRKVILGTLDHIKTADYLTWVQKDRLSDQMIQLLPLKERWKINRKIEKEMRRLGLD